MRCVSQVRTHTFVSFALALTISTQVVLRFIREDIRALPVKCTIPVVCLFLKFVYLGMRLQCCVFLMSQYNPIPFNLMSTSTLTTLEFPSF